MEKKIIEEILSSYMGIGRDSLIPMLQDIQEKSGYISRDSIMMISRFLNLPTSKIYGVATFYNQFRFEKPGKNHIQLCRGTACHVKGSLKLLETVKALLGVEPGRTTKDGLFSLEVVACMGACGLSPVISVNGEIFARATPKFVKNLIIELKEKEALHARA